MKKAVEAIGKLKYKKDFPIVYVTKSQMQSRVSELIKREYSETAAERDRFFLLTMGFITSRVDIRGLRLKIFLENAGGMYDLETDTLYALNDHREVNPINALVLIHELRHAIQDQYYDLESQIGAFSEFDDRGLSRLAAVEGDASFFMAQYSGFIPELMSSYEANSLLSLSPIANTSVLNNVPPVFKYQLIMPYRDGLNFVNSIFERRKWKGLHKILTDPPVSTEQILHPEKYLKNESPLEITIGFKPPGFDLFHEGVIGEFFLNVLLSGDDSPGDFAAGWGGDRFQIYRNSDRYILLWESLWDKDNFAGRFYHDLKRFLEHKFEVNFKPGKRKYTPFIAGNSTWGYFFLRRFKNKVFYLRTNDRDEINAFIRGGYYD